MKAINFMPEINIRRAGKAMDFKKSIKATLVFLLVFGVSNAAWAQAENALIDVGYSSLPGERVMIKLDFEKAPQQPASFTIENPARIAFDLPGVATKLTRKTQTIGIGAARSVSAVEAKGRTRVVFNLISLVPYEAKIEGNSLVVTLDGMVASSAQPLVKDAVGRSIKSVDFRRGKEGEGRLTVSLSSNSIAIDVKEEGGKVIAKFPNTQLKEELVQRLDVIDFATPVTFIEMFSKGEDSYVEIEAEGIYEHLAYQSNLVFTLEVKPVKPEEQERRKKEELGYTGEKLSLNFQNIEVRAVLQLIADFTGLNLVASDTVSGSVTLRLKNVPWDQALDIVLRTKGLAMRQMGNVLLVAPAEEIAAREKAELEATQQIKSLEPLRTELVQVNYAKAGDLANLLKAQETTMLSDRGSVSVDERTNTLLVQETNSKLVEIRKLVNSLDVPIRQVLIESRVVIANDNFTKDLGVRFGGSFLDPSNDGMIGITGSSNGINSMMNSAMGNIAATGDSTPVALPALDDRLAVNLPSAGAAGKIGLGILGPDYLIDLELSAMQQEGQGEVLSNPRVITGNQKEATIEQGVEVPYLEASSSGATSVSFKKAVLSLRVTPQITPDDRVIMDLAVNKDSVGVVYADVPSINTREINTQVLVNNGETVVLGGILEQEIREDVTKVPLFGDLPVVGALFRSSQNVDTKEELLIFITPRILKEDLRVQ